MINETIGVTVTYGNKPVTFYLRMISVPEETKLRQKMFGLTEKEQEEKSYQNNVDLLADLSTKQPDGILPEGVLVKGFPSGAVQSYFKEKTVIKERIAEYAVRGYFLKLQPEVSFS